ncbi:Growth-regulating factor 10 [Hibiscus syriacus]|uniref:Growth-regulating factor n=1 Tax=Hibiscus syriacus TaxID=106335 RepID=A0A6A3A5X6_HIBSY|nr:Growth-regulating factor 10 [Hibiscus syriacus]
MDVQPVQSRVHPGGGGSGAREWLEGKRTVEMEEEEEKEGSPSIKLGLGIDRKMSEKVTPLRKHGKSGGIQVPVSLVIPIWKRVASSVASAAVGVYHRYPSFVGVSPQAFDYRNMVDPEPGRCRRTDGKKWRCSKDVIPHQKYCLQHMHRGCRRSRKPVETTQTALPNSTSSEISIKLLKNLKTLSAPVCSQYMNRSSRNTSTGHETPAIAAIGSDNVCGNRDSISGNASTSTITAIKNYSENDSKRIRIEKCEEKLSVSDGSTINRSCKSVNKVTVANNISPNVGFSPKSVLQGLLNLVILHGFMVFSVLVAYACNVLAEKCRDDEVVYVLGNSSSRVYKNEIEVELGRCRRTDGKRWRCSRDVIPDKKYCARHMHRGARKHTEVSQPFAVPTNGDSRHSGLTIANKATCPALSTSCRSRYQVLRSLH